MQKRVCLACNIEKDIAEFHKNCTHGKVYHKRTCLLCCRKRELDKYHILSIEEKRARKAKANLAPNYMKKWKLSKKYGLTLEEYHQMLTEQNSKCYLCENVIEGRDLKVDHNHKTGKVRKLLCHLCNSGLGSFKENVNVLKKTISYLEDHS